ncbi:MAG: glycosyltransferase family 2 protein [Candidatus Parabeggiatoa sp. nov. 3]|nr:MAG: glycosyltransferase family 2 protein [Gammaproteobacteria bacterium]RKZ68589.1 MAG: glycosyltransferase family 2 protein [Gammaproteobacteria bacterium]RKZ88322.1 MAG: glycosyltransferase family 2 protein [Gammaproteobacteria bacterium]
MNSLAHYEPLIILIPAKNEVKTVGQVVSEVKARFAVTVVVIDDASTDETQKVARAAGATVLPLPFSLGAWGAIQTGLRYASKHGFNTALTMDADGQHEADSIQALLAPLASQQCDVVVGAYPQRGSLLRRIAWTFFRKVSGIALEDLTSGLRAYNRPAITLLASKAATLLDYQDMGVLILLHKAGLHVMETPILMYPRIVGHSRIFSSWWAVSQYMLHTGILCLARFKLSK